VTAVRRSYTLALVFLALAACSTLAACSSATGSRAVTEVRDQQYRPGLGADLYLPGGSHGNGPAVVLVHGGGFVGGSRGDVASYAQALADRGIVVMAIDYRLSQGNWFPAQRLDDPGLLQAAAMARDDTSAAIEWLRGKASQFHVDPRHIAVAGYSAGAITAIEVAIHDQRVVGAVSIAGSTVEPQAMDPADPPLLLIHGAQDDVIPIRFAQDTCRHAQEVGEACALRTVDATKHEVFFTHMSEIVDAIDSFVKDAAPRG
jgi:acetyl esterase/lipase